MTDIINIDDLFWLLIQYKSKKFTGKLHADYEGNIPNFHNFGSLPMLVPQLEMLFHGYNVIYFDVDQSLIIDPIPFMVKGDADFISSIEIRSCPEIYPSSYKYNMDWRVEPNTGILYIKATNQGVDFYLAFLDNIVQKNIRNDQIVFSHTYKNATFVGNCNFDDSSNATVRASDDERPTYCFLSEILFQNGKVGVLCNQKGQSKDDWVMAMIEQGRLFIDC